MIKQQLTQKIQQRLSPLQLQQIKMLELSALEMENRIKEELEENPALEEGLDQSELPDNEQELENSPTEQEISLGDYMSEDDIPPHQLEANNTQRESKEMASFLSSVSTSFYDHLINQLSLRDLNDKQLKIAQFIVGSIEEDGYLRRDLQLITDDLAFQEGLTATIDETNEMLDTIQDLDPAGVGARNLRECLLLQLGRKRNTHASNIAYSLLDECFDEFSRKHFDKIKSRLAITSEELKEAMDEIISLNPKPGNAWNEAGNSSAESVTPDFLVETLDGEIYISLNNQNTPTLRVNPHYLHMIQDYAGNKTNRTRESTAAISFIKQKLDSAKWFVDSVRQRQETLLGVINAIVRLQRQFFLSGEAKSLRPMTLKNVAEVCGYDISTISRVSNSKYVETNFGIFALKYFFSDSMQTESGEDVSSREVKQLLKEFIDEEDKQSPLPDEKLCELLQSRGYVIARRTVAKYREQLNLPVARLRRQV